MQMRGKSPANFRSQPANYQGQRMSFNYSHTFKVIHINSHIYESNINLNCIIQSMRINNNVKQGRDLPSESVGGGKWGRGKWEGGGVGFTILSSSAPLSPVIPPPDVKFFKFKLFNKNKHIYRQTHSTISKVLK